MYLLYVDESGSPADPNQNHFVLAGISVFERETHWIEQKLNDIASRFDAADPYSIELHGSPMRSGRGIWKGIPLDERIQAMQDALQVIPDRGGKVRIFASVAHCNATVEGDTVSAAFEQIASRFDMFLMRQHHKGNTQRGVAIFDKSTTEKSIQNLARTYKHDGHSWGRLRNFSEVPLFLDSQASRLIQLADLVAFAIFRHHERQDSQFYNIIRHCFDSNRGQQHGLHLNLPAEVE